jgi:hypothetical protein
MREWPELEPESDLQWVAEIFGVFGGPSAKKTDMLRIFGELCGSSHISERNDVTEVILMVRVGIGKLHNGYFGSLHCWRSFVFCSHFGSPI